MKILFQIIFWFIVILAVIATIVIIRANRLQKKKDEEKLKKLQDEFDVQKYARNRIDEYPSTGDQLDMMYKDNKNSTTTHADAVEAVKTKWPKDNSGPV